MNHLDAKHYRENISHRVAVKVLCEVSTALNHPHKHPNFYDSCWDFRKRYDSSVYDMIEEIKQLQEYKRKYLELKNVISKLVE